MTPPNCYPLPYPDDVPALFRPLAALPWAQWLDSAGRDRYDILVAAPRITLITRGDSTEICRDGRCSRSGDDPLDLLRRALDEAGPRAAVPPFGGGAVGYFGYDLARRFDALPAQAEDDLALPEMAVGIYDWAVVVDHAARRCWLSGDEMALHQWQALSGQAAATGAFTVREAPRSDLPEAAYARAFARVQHYLREGDCYQVNLAQRFCAAAEGDAYALYVTLRRENPAPFAAWLNFPFGQVLSASPERFLRVQGRQVETRPIKGTRPRLADPQADRAQAEALRASPKDRAENLMIVDLLRNDLGKSCAPGSVQVPQLFAVESFATVHHLVSTVSGELVAGRDALDLLRGCFPGGSITGAPKRRAMEIIEELEPHRRGVYCGAIGYIGFDGNMDTNIAIRTLVHSRGRVCFAAGGGIVTDSTAAEEYQESLDKAAALLRVLERHREPHGSL
ncbi:MAG: aminodeoxychorismate synthase component I [Pseudomonadota bacterium]